MALNPSTGMMPNPTQPRRKFSSLYGVQRESIYNLDMLRASAAMNVICGNHDWFVHDAVKLVGTFRERVRKSGLSGVRKP